MAKNTEKKAEKKPERPNVFAYHDYRKFLSDLFDHERQSRKGFSLRKLSRELGFASGYLPMVLSGERQLSDEALAVMLPALNLSKVEQRFFQAVHSLGSARSRELRLDALARMKKFSLYRKANPKEVVTYEYLTRWYYVAIRELAATPDFKAEPAWIQDRLRVRLTIKEIKDALQFLFGQGYLVQRPDGTVALAEQHLECMAGIYRISIQQYHKQMLTLANQSLENATEVERTVLGHTFAIPADQFQKANSIMQNAFKQMQALEKEIGTAKADTVLQAEFALFPLTQKGMNK